MLDLHLNAIALFHKQRRVTLFPHPARGSGDDHIARAEAGEGADVLDQLRNLVDHAAGVVFLHHAAVQPGADCQLVRIRDLIRRRHPGAKRAGLTPVFSGGKPGVLPVTGGAVHVAAVARHVAQRVVAADVLPTFADDHRQLAFVVEFTGVARLQHRFVMAGL